MSSDAPFQVVIAGGGVAALEAGLALHELGADRLALTLVAPGEQFRFRPLTVAEPFSAGHAGELPLASFARDVDARLVKGAASAVDDGAGELHLDSGESVACDALLLAVGARAVPWLAGALTWFDERDPDIFGGLLRDLEEGYTRRVAFVVPPRGGWPLPLYELALMTARQVSGMGIDDAELTLVTPEAAPLSLFGPRASTAVAAELERAGVEVRVNTWAEPGGGRHQLLLRPADAVLEAERVVTLPRLEGRRIEGVPADRDGFTPVDSFGRVIGLKRVWAAGDGTAFPVKQGGVATQQADAAATSIAGEAGLDVKPEPLEPVLRGTLLTGDRPWHMRWSPGRGDGEVAHEPLWWPPTKVAGRWLSTYLAGHGEAPEGMSVDVSLGGLGEAAEGDSQLSDLEERGRPAPPHAS
jgi:sulfide:quinone oxidoreductase